MAFPSFSHATAGTVNFAQAPVSPLIEIRLPRQLQQESENGEIFTLTLSDERIVHTLSWQDMDSSDYSAMLTFFRAIPWGADSFTYTDTDGADHTVWYDNTQRWQWQRTSAGTYTGTLVLLEDLTT